MVIRLASEQDIPGMIDLLRQVGEVHHQIRPDLFRSGAHKYDEAALTELLTDKARPIFIAAEENRVLGYCFCIHREYDGTGAPIRRKEIYIDDLCVDEGHRGQGVATALYTHVTNYARESGCSHITLNVWCGNDSAMRFYEKSGLTPRSITMEAKL